MRLSILAAVAATLLATPAARACEVGCRPAVVVFPVYTEAGLRIGTVTARVHRPPSLEVSPITGQPLPVVFNNPGSLPGAVDPGLVLMRLPQVKPSTTRAVYPRGY